MEDEIGFVTLSSTYKKVVLTYLHADALMQRFGRAWARDAFFYEKFYDIVQSY